MFFNDIRGLYKSIFQKISDQGFLKGRERLKDLETQYFTFVFLCGGNTKEYDSRNVLLRVFNENEEINTLICENLQMLMSELDLLSFEKILADISKMIIIPVESIGTACELGAFTYLSPEDNKVVAIIDKKYSLNDSFIILGPIAALRKMGRDRVIITSFNLINGITRMMLSQEISNLNKHSLLNSHKNSGYLFSISKEEERTILEIWNFYTFFAFLIDFACVFKRINQGMVEDYLRIVYKAETISFKELSRNVDKDHIFNCLFNLLVRFEYLMPKKDRDFFTLNREFVSKKKLPSDYDFGSILFTKIIRKVDKKNKIKLFSEISILSEKEGKYENR